MKMMQNLLWVSCFVLSVGCRPADNSNLDARAGVDDVNQIKNEIFMNLSELMTSGRFLFGQERATLSGVGRDGTKPWGDNSYGTEPDSQKLVGDQPAILGMDVWDFAMKNPTWNQPAYTKAAHDFYANGKGGLVAFDWHMRGCDIAEVADAAGNRGVPGNGFKVDDWNNDSNRSCLCRIVNEEPWMNGMTWKDWLFTQKLDRFATKLQAEGLDLIPMIFRPFHEMNGSWFWWGAKSWDCQKHLGRNNVITGVEAYKKLFQITIDYLRNNRNLRNMLVAFSPDKLCKHEGHSCDPARAQNDNPTDQELYNDFMNMYPGKAYVDILGLDLYYAVNTGKTWETPEYQSAIFARYLQTVSRIAKEEGKVAALTETGNYNLHNEVNTSADWFTKHLLPLLTDSGVNLAYALTWENRAINLTEYYIPYVGHAAYADFKDFASNSKTMLLRDAAGLFTADVKNPRQPDSIAPNRDIGTSPGVETCQSPNSDVDGDGWGWENNKSCLVAVCKALNADPDGDGWGYENNQSCRVKAAASSTIPVCKDVKSDADGDGWGWENNSSCQVLLCQGPNADPDGDGWGWENNQSCKVKGR